MTIVAIRWLICFRLNFPMFLWWVLIPCRKSQYRNEASSTASIACLTHWGRVTYICVGYLAIIGSDNGLLPGRRQAIIWIIVGILLIGPLGINFSEILIEIKIFSFKKMHLKVSSVKGRLFLPRPQCVKGIVISVELLNPWIGYLLFWKHSFV